MFSYLCPAIRCAELHAAFMLHQDRGACGPILHMSPTHQHSASERSKGGVPRGCELPSGSGLDGFQQN